MPSMKNWRKDAGAIQRPSGPVSVANRPMANEPETLTSKVPQGKVSPNRSAIKPDAHHRARLPRPPPIKIQSAFAIVRTLPLSLAVTGVISTETYQAVFSRTHSGDGKPHCRLPRWRKDVVMANPKIVLRN